MNTCPRHGTELVPVVPRRERLKHDPLAGLPVGSAAEAIPVAVEVLHRCSMPQTACDYIRWQELE